MELVFSCALAGRPVPSGLLGRRKRPSVGEPGHSTLGSRAAGILACKAARGREGRALVCFGHYWWASE